MKSQILNRKHDITITEIGPNRMLFYMRRYRRKNVDGQLSENGRLSLEFSARMRTSYSLSAGSFRVREHEY